MALLNKTLVALGFLFVFGFGLLSVSFAAYEEVGPTAVHQYVKFHHEKRHGLARAEKNDLQGAVLLDDEGILPKPPHVFSEAREAAELVARSPQIVLLQQINPALKSCTLSFSPVLNL